MQQPFDTSLLLRREVDTIQAKTYNEYAQLLEATNPDTGELYQPEDFVAINLNELGYDSLEDGIYAQADWLADGDNADIAQRFLEASFKGWGRAATTSKAASTSSSTPAPRSARAT